MINSLGHKMGACGRDLKDRNHPGVSSRDKYELFWTSQSQVFLTTRPAMESRSGNRGDHASRSALQVLFE